VEGIGASVESPATATVSVLANRRHRAILNVARGTEARVQDMAVDIGCVVDALKFNVAYVSHHIHLIEDKSAPTLVSNVTTVSSLVIGHQTLNS